MLSRSSCRAARSLSRGLRPLQSAPRTFALPIAARCQSTASPAISQSGDLQTLPPGMFAYDAKALDYEPATQEQLDHKGRTKPPGYKGGVCDLQTFQLPDVVRGTPGDVAMGRAMIDAWRREGMIQIKMDAENARLAKEAFKNSREFFSKSTEQKQACVDDQSFAGYIASGEEITDGVADYSEIFTVTKDLPVDDSRVQAKWPCHGPCPWPDQKMQQVMQGYMDYLGSSGERLLQLMALGLGLPDLNTLTNYTKDGWHHMRILRFPKAGDENGKGVKGRGIGSHTDYGFLVIAAQDEVGGLFIRPPYPDEKFKNWEKSSAGMAEDDDRWNYVPPEEGVFTVFPGDMLQFMTDNYLPSTPHKVAMNTSERFAFAYFHEPNFCATMRPLEGDSDESVHYGTHFTNMFMRNYPERITAKRIEREGRMATLEDPSLHQFN